MRVDIKTLTTDEYTLIKSFLDSRRVAPTFTYAVLDQVIKGEIYVDYATEIVAILIVLSNGICYADGDVTQQEYFLDHLVSKAKANNTRFTLFTHSTELQFFFNKKFDEQMRKYERVSYRSFNQKKLAMGNDFCVIPHNLDVINASREFPVSYYETYWGNPNQFLEKGLGIAIKDGNDVIAECVSIFLSQQFAEIDIWTAPSYRGRGLGFATASSFIKRVLDKKMTPRWDCDSSNIASLKLGEKLGFENSEPYTVYSLIHE